MASTNSESITDINPKKRICSEFYSARHREVAYFEKINTIIQYERLKTNALGYSLTQMYLGDCSIFYKANVKFWDIIAPLCLLSLTQGHFWDIELITYDNICISPFSNDSSFINYLNKQHQQDCRVGLLTVTPKHQPEFKSIIKDCVYE